MVLINLLQRHQLWIFLLLSGLSGLALGNLSATVAGMLAAPEIQAEQAPLKTSELAESRQPLSAYQPILSRDIFNSAGGSQSFTAQKNTKTAQAAATKVPSKWTLIGTISGGLNPLATLNDSKETTAYRLNDKLSDDSVLSSIERNRVELRYLDGRIQILEITQDGLNLPVAANSKTVTRDKGPQIRSLGENRWQIPAQVAEDSRANIGNLLRQAQAIPYLEGNQTTGFQMKMIQPGSLIAQLGLKQGDVLREINGVRLNSPEKALQVFGQLRQAKQVSIGLERRGKAMTFAYEIR